MRKLSYALLLLAAASTPVAAQVNTDVAINEVFYGGGAGQDWVELINTGTGAIDISNFWFCTRFGYSRLGAQTIIVGDDFSLDPGEIVVVSPGRDLNNSAADLALYQTNSFGDPNQLLDFVQWGTDSRVGRSNEANSRGVWLGEVPVDFVPTAQPGESVSFCGSNSGGGLLTFSSDLMNGAPSQGTNNDALCLVQEEIFADGFEDVI